MIRAALAVQTGGRDDHRAVEYLRAALETAERHDRLVLAMAARRRLGELLGGDEGDTLIAQADEWMTGEGIVNPDRMIELVAPGFGHRG